MTIAVDWDVKNQTKPGQVWYMIVSIPDLCFPLFFVMGRKWDTLKRLVHLYCGLLTNSMRRVLAGT